MRGLQPNSVAESVVVELVTQKRFEPAMIHDTLTTLVEDGDLKRLDGKREPRYQLITSQKK
jgi:hypothetical protein